MQEPRPPHLRHPELPKIRAPHSPGQGSPVSSTEMSLKHSAATCHPPHTAPTWRLAAAEDEHPAAHEAGAVASAVPPGPWVHRPLRPPQGHGLQAPHVAEAAPSATSTRHHQLLAVPQGAMRLDTKPYRSYRS